jgi:hypothetical protein
MQGSVRVKRGDKTYWWDPDAKRIKVSFEEAVDTEHCPVDVLNELMLLLSEKAFGKKVTEPPSQDEIDQLLQALNSAESISKD